MTRTTPKPGDAIRLDSPFWGAPEGSFAIIDGCATYPEPYLMVTFGASAFRGPNSAYSHDQTAYVSCSGGPCPPVNPASLSLIGTHVVTFWRWKDLPRAGGGENYQLEVPLWSWKPPSRNGDETPWGS